MCPEGGWHVLFSGNAFHRPCTGYKNPLQWPYQTTKSGQWPLPLPKIAVYHLRERGRFSRRYQAKKGAYGPDLKKI